MRVSPILVPVTSSRRFRSDPNSRSVSNPSNTDADLTAKSCSAPSSPPCAVSIARRSCSTNVSAPCRSLSVCSSGVSPPRTARWVARSSWIATAGLSMATEIGLPASVFIAPARIPAAFARSAVSSVPRIIADTVSLRTGSELIPSIERISTSLFSSIILAKFCLATASSSAVAFGFTLASSFESCRYTAFSIASSPPKIVLYPPIKKSAATPSTFTAPKPTVVASGVIKIASANVLRRCSMTWEASSSPSSAISGNAGITASLPNNRLPSSVPTVDVAANSPATTELVPRTAGASPQTLDNTCMSLGVQLNPLNTAEPTPPPMTIAGMPSAIRPSTVLIEVSILGTLFSASGV